VSGEADYLLPGDWNVTCDLCGRKAKAINVEKTWDNQYVCRHHKERRNPQDYLRGIKDDPSVPFSRPQPPLSFVSNSHELLQENGGGILMEYDAEHDTYYLLH
jgi:hypothetical protein